MVILAWCEVLDILPSLNLLFSRFYVFYLWHSKANQKQWFNSIFKWIALQNFSHYRNRRSNKHGVLKRSNCRLYLSKTFLSRQILWDCSLPLPFLKNRWHFTISQRFFPKCRWSKYKSVWHIFIRLIDKYGLKWFLTWASYHNIAKPSRNKKTISPFLCTKMPKKIRKINSLGANPTKWSNTLKQFVGILWDWRLKG